VEEDLRLVEIKVGPNSSSFFEMEVGIESFEISDFS
jgi:hypothetical protein